MARRAPRSAPRRPSTDPVGIDRHDDVLSILPHRPAVHNAYNAAMRDGLVAALQVAALDTTVRLVRMAGAGPSFCSGGDLSEFGPPAIRRPPTPSGSAGGRPSGWTGCSDRTSVHVHGACIGAGVELAAFAHRVEADPDTYFRLPEVAMGLVPGAGGTVEPAPPRGAPACRLPGHRRRRHRRGDRGAVGTGGRRRRPLPGMATLTGIGSV